MDLVQRIPSGLWEHLQDLTARTDDAFLRDVSRIADIPFLSLRKLFPTRGVLTKLATDGHVPWWHDQQCSMVEKQPSGIWMRCSAPMMEGPTCSHHRNKKPGDSLKVYTDPYLSTLPTRVPVRIREMSDIGDVVWCGADGALYTLDGTLVKGYTYSAEHQWLVEVTKNE
jgi:hypothetical protein